VNGAAVMENSHSTDRRPCEEKEENRKKIIEVSKRIMLIKQLEFL